MIDIDNINIVWKILPPTDNENLESLIRSDIKSSLRSLKSLADLVIHTVFIGDIFDGDSILVWGIENDNNHLYCEWHKGGPDSVVVEYVNKLN